ncbi:hypothetical protein GH140_04340 [bacterium]|nr:hypothetical protein [bacterium]
MESNRCLQCKGDLPESSYHFSNIVALRHGFCCFSCMLAKLGPTRAYANLATEKEEARRRL